LSVNVSRSGIIRELLPHNLSTLSANASSTGGLVGS
jgi:hypothetical protein